LVEREPSKLGVAGSSPVSRSSCQGLMAIAVADSHPGAAIFEKPSTKSAQVAQSVEHVLGKDEVGGSIPLLGFALPHDSENYQSAIA